MKNQNNDKGNAYRTTSFNRVVSTNREGEVSPKAGVIKAGTDLRVKGAKK